MNDGFFIYSPEHSPIDGAAGWWGPNGCGYFSDPDKAGIYSEEEVRALPLEPGKDIAIPELEVWAMVQKRIPNYLAQQRVEKHKHSTTKGSYGRTSFSHTEG